MHWYESQRIAATMNFEYMQERFDNIMVGNSKHRLLIISSDTGYDVVRDPVMHAEFVLIAKDGFFEIFKNRRGYVFEVVDVMEEIFPVEFSVSKGRLYLKQEEDQIIMKLRGAIV